MVAAAQKMKHSSYTRPRSAHTFAHRQTHSGHLVLLVNLSRARRNLLLGKVGDVVTELHCGQQDARR
jgi:hypothetical protein